MKILISGAGIAGLTCAYRLTKFGFTPVVLEKSKELRDEGYMIDFLGEGLQISEAMGIFQILKETSAIFQGLQLVDRRGKKVGGFSFSMMEEYMASRGHKYIPVTRGDLERTLYESLDDRSIIRFGEYITGLVEKEDGMHVDFASGEKEIYDIVIGADGIHSSTREMTRGIEKDVMYGMGSKVLITRLPGLGKKEQYQGYATSHLSPGRMLITVPTKDEDLLVICGVETDESLSKVREDAHTFIKNNFGSNALGLSVCDGLKEDTFVFVDDIAQVHMDSRYKGRVVLIGDAASCPTLLSGQGAHMAMTQAYVLAHQLSLYTNSYTKAFEGYEETLFELVKERMKIAKKLQGTIIPKTRFATVMSYILFGLMKYKRMIRLAFAQFTKPTLFDRGYPLESD